MKFLATAALLSLVVLASCATPIGPPASTAPAYTPLPQSPASSPASSTTATTTVGAASMVAETPKSSATLTRTYRWTYGGKQWTWQLELPQALYDYFKALPRSPTSNYSVYVTHPMDDPYIGQLVSKIKDASRLEGYSDFESVEFAASFVQSLPYVPDNVSTGYDEYPRYPIETLVDNGGDCEDSSILVASLIREMGYGAVLLRFEPTAGLAGHLAVGVAGGEGVQGTYWDYAGRKYYYLETTNTGWKIGQIPDQYRAASAHILTMEPVPILTHTWTSTGRGEYADLQVVVSNLGSAPAQGVYIYAGFDAGGDRMWNAEKSAEFQVGIDEKVTVALSLRVPYGQHTRIVVQIVYGGYAVDNSYSKWFDT